MTLFNDKYRIESTRRLGWDYAGDGWYFVTICVQDRVCCFGEISDNVMHLSPIGAIVNEEWRKTADIRPNVILDEYQVMPNHFHAILGITRVETPRRGVLDGVTKTPRRGVSTLKPDSLGSIIGQFKRACSKRIWAANHEFHWQPRFHDRIIRDEHELELARAYIRNNPANWAKDKHNPDNHP